jgi:hypothetical protein
MHLSVGHGATAVFPRSFGVGGRYHSGGHLPISTWPSQMGSGRGENVKSSGHGTKDESFQSALAPKISQALFPHLPNENNGSCLTGVVGSVNTDRKSQLPSIAPA